MRMAETVTAGKYFIIDPLHGGYYATSAEEHGIETNGRILPAPPPAPEPDNETEGEGDQ